MTYTLPSGDVAAKTRLPDAVIAKTLGSGASKTGSSG